GTRATHDDFLGKRFKAVLIRTGLRQKGFYALRHTCFTIACECDWQAARAILGHVDSTVSSEYVERIADHRLHKVVAYLHSWLFGAPNASTLLPLHAAV